VAVDYVNDHIDLRMQSKAADGVPNEILAHVAADLVGLVAQQRPRRWFEQLIPRFWSKA
jgi:hypothetical protein